MKCRRKNEFCIKPNFVLFFELLFDPFHFRPLGFHPVKKARYSGLFCCNCSRSKIISICSGYPFLSLKDAKLSGRLTNMKTALNPEHCIFGDEGNIQCTPIVVAVCRSFKLRRMKQKSGKKGGIRSTVYR